MKKIIKFFIFGITNVIPGVCSATTAIILDIYKELLESIENVFKPTKWKDNMLIYFSIIVGVLVGIFVLNKLYYLCPFLLTICFLSFVIKSYPLNLNIKNSKIKLFPYIGGLAIVIGLNVISNYILQINYVKMELLTCIIIVINGILVSFGMILPGISGASMLVSFGLYFPLLEGIIDVVSFVTRGNSFNVNSFMLIVIFSVSFLTGLVCFSKMIKKRINDNSINFNSFINGMIMATIINIMLDLRNHFTNWPEVIVGIMIMVIIYLIPKKNKVNL